MSARDKGMDVVNLGETKVLLVGGELAVGCGMVCLYLRGCAPLESSGLLFGAAIKPSTRFEAHG